MVDARSCLEWVKESGEVKSLDRLLVKVMLQLVKHKVTLTVSDVEKHSSAIMVPEPVYEAMINAARDVVGKPYPSEQFNRPA